LAACCLRRRPKPLAAQKPLAQEVELPVEYAVDALAQLEEVVVVPALGRLAQVGATWLFSTLKAVMSVVQAATRPAAGRAAVPQHSSSREELMPLVCR
jgi:hypothetical protein